MSLECTIVCVAPANLSLCQVSLPCCPVIEEQNGVGLRNKPQQYNFHDTTTSIRHLVAPLFHENACPTFSKSLLILKYSHLQNLYTLENHTVARNRAVWEFYVICAFDIQPKLAGSSSVRHAFKRYSALIQRGHVAILIAPSELQNVYNEIGPVHLYCIFWFQISDYGHISKSKFPHIICRWYTSLQNSSRSPRMNCLKEPTF